MSKKSTMWADPLAYTLMHQLSLKTDLGYPQICEEHHKTCYDYVKARIVEKGLIELGYAVRTYPCDSHHFHLTKHSVKSATKARAEKARLDRPTRQEKVRVFKKGNEWCYSCPLHPEQGKTLLARDMGNVERARARAVRHLRRAHGIIV